MRRTFACLALALATGCGDEILIPLVPGGYYAVTCGGCEGATTIWSGLLRDRGEFSVDHDRYRIVASWSAEDIAASCAPRDDDVLAQTPLDEAYQHPPIRAIPWSRITVDTQGAEHHPATLAGTWPDDALNDQNPGCWRCCIDPERSAPPYRRLGGCVSPAVELTDDLCREPAGPSCCSDPGPGGRAVIRHLECNAGERPYDARACGPTSTSTSACPIDRRCPTPPMSAFIRHERSAAGIAPDGKVWIVSDGLRLYWASGLSKNRAYGLNHSCAVAGGRLQCSGYNTYGQLGVGPPSTQHGVVDVPAPEGEWRAVDASQSTTCASTTLGSVYCWGLNTRGEAGVAGNAMIWTPTRVIERGVETLLLDWEVGCAVETGGRASCWGQPFRDIVGLPTAPGAPLERLPGSWASLAVGSKTLCGIRPDRSAACWGLGAVLARDPTELGPGLDLPGRWRTIAPGDEMSCGITEAGQLMCWGPSTYGACEYVRRAVAPISIGAAGDGPWRDVITDGKGLACALDATSTMICWGRGSRNQGERLRPEVACMHQP